MKKLKLLLLLLFMVGLTNAQSILPSPTAEYCPNQEMTFTATITKPFQSLIGINGALVTVQPSPPVGSTFTFKGKFSDANEKQSFEVQYTDGSHYDFTIF